MSTKDKAREKLLNSMRKTKEVINDQPDVKQAHAETYAPPAAKPAKKPAAAKTAKAGAATSARPMPASDPYQSGGRIWPD
ncbi:MAG: hypothetical protein P8Z72_14905 [Gammaproteobacteria bacterium]|jgi:hypothetical protein